MEKLKYLFSVIAGALLAYMGAYIVLYGLVFCAILFDLITGCMAAVISGKGLSSSKAARGVLKKLVLLIALGFGTFLDVFIPFAAKTVNFDFNGSLIFSTVICVYIVVTECISICENILICNKSALPSWLLKLLNKAQSDIDTGKK